MAGTIDRGIEARTPKEREVLALIRQRGLSLRRTGRGTVLHLHGPGVDVRSDALRNFSRMDTEPFVVRVRD